eukprot:TRINITY_DN3650_c0_g1_i1.p1 TRINITY_DN3650_c0_g1~~TRINITY_DN3650_c0_g1_i1.p1  ORF type:complete len:967 (+),score=137.23 TRINITY_DN3650_c0_g1_i1:85-2985(+)
MSRPQGNAYAPTSRKHPAWIESNEASVHGSLPPVNHPQHSKDDSQATEERSSVAVDLWSLLGSNNGIHEKPNAFPRIRSYDLKILDPVLEQKYWNQYREKVYPRLLMTVKLTLLCVFVLFWDTFLNYDSNQQALNAASFFVISMLLLFIQKPERGKKYCIRATMVVYFIILVVSSTSRHLLKTRDTPDTHISVFMVFVAIMQPPFAKMVWLVLFHIILATVPMIWFLQLSAFLTICSTLLLSGFICLSTLYVVESLHKRFFFQKERIQETKLHCFKEKTKRRVIIENLYPRLVCQQILSTGNGPGIKFTFSLCAHLIVYLGSYPFSKAPMGDDRIEELVNQLFINMDRIINSSDLQKAGQIGLLYHAFQIHNDQEQSPNNFLSAVQQIYDMLIKEIPEGDWRIMLHIGGMDGFIMENHHRSFFIFGEAMPTIYREIERIPCRMIVATSEFIKAIRINFHQKRMINKFTIIDPLTLDIFSRLKESSTVDADVETMEWDIKDQDLSYHMIKVKAFQIFPYYRFRDDVLEAECSVYFYTTTSSGMVGLFYSNLTSLAILSGVFECYMGGQATQDHTDSLFYVNFVRFFVLVPLVIMTGFVIYLSDRRLVSTKYPNIGPVLCSIASLLYMVFIIFKLWFLSAYSSIFSMMDKAESSFVSFELQIWLIANMSTPFLNIRTHIGSILGVVLCYITWSTAFGIRFVFGSLWTASFYILIYVLVYTILYYHSCLMKERAVRLEYLAAVQDSEKIQEYLNERLQVDAALKSLFPPEMHSLLEIQKDLPFKKFDNAMVLYLFIQSATSAEDTFIELLMEETVQMASVILQPYGYRFIRLWGSILLYIDFNGGDPSRIARCLDGANEIVREVQKYLLYTRSAHASLHSYLDIGSISAGATGSSHLSFDAWGLSVSDGLLRVLNAPKSIKKIGESLAKRIDGMDGYKVVRKNGQCYFENNADSWATLVESFDWNPIHI